MKKRREEEGGEKRVARHTTVKKLPYPGPPRPSRFGQQTLARSSTSLSSGTSALNLLALISSSCASKVGFALNGIFPVRLVGQGAVSRRMGRAGRVVGGSKRGQARPDNKSRTR